MKSKTLSIAIVVALALMLIFALAVPVLANVFITIDIDIKPGSTHKVINMKSEGVIPVAILGSENFDVTDIDVTTILFGQYGEGGPGAVPFHDPAGHLEDVNGDGFTDLVCHFKTQETSLDAGIDWVGLTAQLNDGRWIEGSNNVTILHGN